MPMAKNRFLLQGEGKSPTYFQKFPERWPMSAKKKVTSIPRITGTVNKKRKNIFTMGLVMMQTKIIIKDKTKRLTVTKNKDRDHIKA